MDLVDWIKHIIQKLISAGGTITFTLGAYSFVLTFESIVGPWGLQIPKGLAFELVKAIVSLLAGYGIWINGVTKLEKFIMGETKTTKAMVTEEKSGFALV